MPGLARRLAGTILLAALILGPVAAALLAVETRPSVPRTPPPDASAAARTRDFAQSLRAVIESGVAQGEISFHIAQLDALLSSARRLKSGLDGAARIEDDHLILDVSTGTPLIPDGYWANFHFIIEGTDRGPKVMSARLGQLPLPAALVMPALRLALDRFLGEGLGTMLLAGIDRLTISDDRLALGSDFPETDRARLQAELKTRVRAFAGGTSSQRISSYLVSIDRAGDRQNLPRQGTVLPYLRHAVETAWSRPRDEDREELKAALLALTLYCGEEAFGPAVGASLGPGMVGKRNNCARTTLGNRDDLKRHSIVSAGIYAARTGGAAFGMGELKELLDSNHGGSGFSFDDMAADLAGARFARLFMDLPISDWPDRLDRMQVEADILPRLDDLPTRLTESEFRLRFGDVDSPAYAVQIAEINRRIDEMPFYQ